MCKPEVIVCQMIKLVEIIFLLPKTVANIVLVMADAKAMCCKFCVFWYRTKCVNISDEIYNLLSLGCDQIHWFFN